ncbi:AraC family transcriptional regulator [Aestuariicella hydrocarbonica]|uniref:AraC family transcriptional regulator n=1 Tax=Pseudomaricurvus hydrocarbonicus TaxID=1470433 RepID=A0A9E5MNF8_9GAMM|nr:AraC family transcriptional regulator [Aestuariicella hydrocarbonica]NHO67498.1 AraC family transcriptional regulator [Aestuariicella hydrocarbonica]
MNTDAPLHQSRINAVYSKLLFRHMERAHADVDQFLAKLQLQRSDFESDDDQIPMSTFLLLMEEAAKYLQDPNLGLHFYQGFDQREQGVLGYALVNCKTLGEAINLVVRYYCLFQNDMSYELAIHDDKAFLSYEVTAKHLPPSRQDSEMTLMAVVVLIRQSVDAGWSPLEAHFQHPAPANLDEHKRVLCDKLLFNQAKNQLVFDPQILQSTLKNADLLLSQSLTTTLEEILKLRQGSSENQWLNTLRNHIIDSLNQGAPAIEDIADKMHMSRRTLQRKVSQEGITFKDLVENTRQELATNYLSASDMPLQDIAFLLGYSDINSFNRAFKRWTQHTPHEYRTLRRTQR